MARKIVVQHGAHYWRETPEVKNLCNIYRALQKDGDPVKFGTLPEGDINALKEGKYWTEE